MAKIKMSGIGITDIRGAISGSVFQKNGYGLFVKRNVTPLYNASVYTNFNRSMFGTLAGIWRNLTPTEQLSWISASANYPHTNSMGDTYYLTGASLFMECNLNLHLINQPILTLAIPVPITQPFFGFNTTINVGTQHLNVNLLDLTPQLISSDWYYLVSCSFNFSAGIQNGKNRVRKIFFVSPNINILELAAPFPLAPGEAYTIQEDFYNYAACIGKSYTSAGTDYLALTNGTNTFIAFDSAVAYFNGTFPSGFAYNDSTVDNVQVGGSYSIFSPVTQFPMQEQIAATPGYRFLFSNYVNRYGNRPLPFQSITIRCILINGLSGQASAPQFGTFNLI